MRVTIPSNSLSAEAAVAAVSAAVAKAAEIGVAVNAAVVDPGGNLLAFLRGDGAFLPSGKIAIDKAYTAVGFKVATGQLYDALKGDAAVLAGISAQPSVALFQGGLPILDGSEIVAGIGISGASAEQDELCAQAGINAIGLGPKQD